MWESLCLFNDFKIGEDYPAPIVDLTKASKEARARLWQYRGRPDVQKAIPAILNTHVSITQGSKYTNKKQKNGT